MQKMFPRELRDLAFVPRWTIQRTIKRQSVAEHSYLVAQYSLMVLRILEILSDETVADVLEYALWHDAAECFTGDLPAPFKQYARQSGLVNFMDLERNGLIVRFGRSVQQIIQHPAEGVKRIVKAADLLERCFFLADESQMGNQAAYKIYEDNERQAIISWMSLSAFNQSKDMMDTLWQRHVEPALDECFNGCLRLEDDAVASEG